MHEQCSFGSHNDSNDWSLTTLLPREKILATGRMHIEKGVMDFH